jgi:16S rRNA (cytidine1402-2'-O)-methyltransferase
MPPLRTWVDRRDRACAVLLRGIKRSPVQVNREGRAMAEPGKTEAGLTPGLHIVSTPIGAAEDITLKALRVLRNADILAAEDTRTLRRLMEIHAIPIAGRKILPYHDHNGPRMRPALMQALEQGKSVAYASDAGTPLISDPGFELARAAVSEGHRVLSAPGASAVLAALAVAGLPTDRFLFAGFPPQKAGARRTMLTDVASVPATLVLYENPKRLVATLSELEGISGPDRPIAMCRELTKRFEEVRRTHVGALRAELEREPPPKGEVVLVLGPPIRAQASPEDVDQTLRHLLLTLSVKDASSEVALRYSLPRREVYARAQALKDEK